MILTVICLILSAPPSIFTIHYARKVALKLQHTKTNHLYISTPGHGPVHYEATK